MQPQPPQDPNQPQPPLVPGGVQQPTNPQPMFQPGQQADPQHPAAYDFILNPQQSQASPKIALAQTDSALKRAVIVGGGLVVLIVLGLILKGLFTSKPNTAAFVTVAQEQQELIHLAKNAGDENSLSQSNKNFALTVQLSITTDQSDTFDYLKLNGKKLKEKDLNLRISPSNDKRLTDAAATDDYNPIFKEVMASELTKYQVFLKQAAATTGPNGRKLINQQFKHTTLLVQQLNDTSNTN